MLGLGRALTPEELGGASSPEAPAESDAVSSASSEPAEQVS